MEEGKARKLFIIQLTDGKSNEEIEQEKQIAFETVKKYIHYKLELIDEVIDSSFKDSTVSKNKLLLFAKSLELLSTADLVYFADGWKNSKIHKLQYMCVTKLGIPNLTFEDLQ